MIFIFQVLQQQICMIKCSQKQSQNSKFMSSLIYNCHQPYSNPHFIQKPAPADLTQILPKRISQWIFLVAVQAVAGCRVRGAIWGWSGCINFMAGIIQFQCMPERKVWSSEEDRILKLLIEERGMRGWSQIARAMEEEFQVAGRSGKQCRERYHNHLDRNINTAEWSAEEEEVLFALQDEVGNKWTLIASKLPGRTDNCIKNHFYSKLRKSLRSLNKKIHKFMKKDYRQIKTTTLYRIIETLENRNRNASVQNDSFALCRKIKNHLYHYEGHAELDNSQELQMTRTIIEDLAQFDKEVKRPKRGSLQSSAKLSEGSRAKGESTRSLYDDESECSNNSSLFSSSSFDHRSLCGSQHLPALVFRSQDIRFESEEESDEQRGQVLYKSATSLAKAQRMPPIQQESAKRESSKHSHSSHSDKSAGEESLCKPPADMFGEESMEMQAISPEQLTAREKMEIREESNDALFYGQMQIEEEGEGNLARDFSKLALSSIPKLSKYTI